MKKTITTILLLISTAAFAKPPENILLGPYEKYTEPYKNFNQSKSIAHKKIYKDDLQFDYYCGCSYNRSKEIDINSCGYKIRKNALRAKRVEWEHVVPASWFGHTDECWYHGGRKNCERESEAFNRFEGDLHNLRPVIGEVNADRSDLSYGVAGPNAKTYGQCKFKIDFTNNVAEPPDNMKGNLARVSLYMVEKYNLIIKRDLLLLWAKWSKEDPVDAKEIELNEKIKSIQGDSNPYVDGRKVVQ